MFPRCLVHRALGVVLALSAMPTMSMAVDIDRILVIVNDDVITEAEFEDRFLGIMRELRQRSDELPPRRVVEEQVLERMITDKIQLQVANRLGISVGDDAVDDAVRTIAANNRMDVAELREALAREGASYTGLRDSVKSQLIIRRLVEREVASRVTVTDEEIDNFLRTQGAGAAKREYDVSHILVRVPEAATPDAIEAARTRAEEVIARIRDGMEFEQAVITYSQAQDALEGGRLGWRQPGQLPGLFVEALDALKVGEITDVLRSPNGFHILKLNDLRGVGSSAITKTHARHILIKTDEFISLQEAERRLLQLRERLMNGEDFTELARAHSDDTVTSVAGGDIGWTGPGETVPQFEAAMDKLQIGEISQPVRTPFGLHLIEVLDRRQEQVGDELDRNNARQQLRARKAEERYEQWLRQLRDESYVEVLRERV